MHRCLRLSGRAALCLGALVIAASACANTRPSRHAEVTPLGPDELLRRGDERARSGQGPGAEQYFEAALLAGASPRDVYPRLVSVCLNGGRLSAALEHVESALEGSPSDERLVALRAALVAALDDEPEAP